MSIIGILSKAKDGLFKELNLSNMGLREIPEEVFSMPWLETLKIMNNNISIIPNEIIGMRKLKNLYLYNNKIAEIDKYTLINMPYLECFDLAENPIDYVDVIEYYYKNNVMKNYWKCLDKVIECQNNKEQDYFRFYGELKKIPMEIFELDKLKSLALSTKYLGKIPREIGELKNLLHLDLPKNNISYLPAEILKIERLESLDLSYNKFEIIPYYILESLPCLKYINFNHNIVKYLDTKIFHKKGLALFEAFDNPFENFDSNNFHYDLEVLQKQFS